MNFYDHCNSLKELGSNDNLLYCQSFATPNNIEIIEVNSDDIDYVSVIIDNDITILIDFLKYSTDVDAYEKLLCDAIDNDCYKIIDYLIPKCNEQQLINAAKISIKKNKIDTFTKIININKITKINSELLICAIMCNNMKIIQYLCKNDYSNPHSIIQSIDNCNINLVKYFLDKIKNNNNFNPKLCALDDFNDDVFPYIKYCVYTYNCIMVEYFIKNNYPVDDYPKWRYKCDKTTEYKLDNYYKQIRDSHDANLVEALKTNDSDKIKYLFSIGAKIKNCNDLLKDAANNGDLNFIKRLVNYGVSVDSSLVIVSIIHNRMNIANWYIDKYLSDDGIKSISCIIDKVINLRSLEYVKRLITLFPKKRYEFCYERSLCTVIEMKEYEIFQYLISIKVNPQILINCIFTLCNNNDLVGLKKIIELNINLECELSNIMIVGIKCQDVNFVKLMIQKGADIKLRNNDAIIFACENENIEIIKILILNGAITSFNQEMPLTMATQKGNLELIKLFVNNGAKIFNHKQKVFIEAVKYKHRHIIEYFLTQHNNIRIDKITFIIEAIKTRDLDFVKYIGSLIMKQKSFKVRTENSIYMFMNVLVQYGTYEIAKYLYKQEKRAFDDYCNIQDNNILYRAFDCQNVDMVKFFHEINNNLIHTNVRPINKCIETKCKKNGTLTNDDYKIIAYLVTNHITLFDSTFDCVLNKLRQERQYNNLSDLQNLIKMGINPNTIIKKFNFSTSSVEEYMSIIQKIIEMDIPIVNIISNCLKSTIISLPLLASYILKCTSLLKNNVLDSMKIIYDYLQSHTLNSHTKWLRNRINRDKDVGHLWELNRIFSDTKISIDDKHYDFLNLLEIVCDANNHFLIEQYYKKCIDNSYNLEEFYENIVNCAGKDYQNYERDYRYDYNHIIISFIKQKTPQIKLKKYLRLLTLLN